MFVRLCVSGKVVWEVAWFEPASVVLVNVFVMLFVLRGGVFTRNMLNGIGLNPVSVFNMSRHAVYKSTEHDNKHAIGSTYNNTSCRLQKRNIRPSHSMLHRASVLARNGDTQGFFCMLSIKAPYKCMLPLACFTSAPFT